jgi:WD40 repeat protein
VKEAHASTRVSLVEKVEKRSILAKEDPLGYIAENAKRERHESTEAIKKRVEEQAQAPKQLAEKRHKLSHGRFVNPRTAFRFLDHGIMKDHHDKAVYCLSWAPDSNRVATCGHDGRVFLWHIDDIEKAKKKFLGHTGWVFQVQFSPDGLFLVTCSADNTLRLWDVATAEMLCTWYGHRDAVMGCSFGMDGHRVVSAGKDKSIRAYDSFRIMREFKKGALVGRSASNYGPDMSIAGYPDNPRGHTGPVQRALFSPPLNAFILSCGLENKIKLWDAKSGGLKMEYAGHTDHVLDIAFSQDGKLFASASHDRTARVWDFKTGAALHVFKCADIVYGVAWSPEVGGRRLATCARNKDVTLWDVDKGKDAFTCDRLHDSWVLCVRFSPDGLRIATASGDRTARVWEAQPVTAADQAIIFASRAAAQLKRGFISLLGKGS